MQVRTLFIPETDNFKSPLSLISNSKSALIGQSYTSLKSVSISSQTLCYFRHFSHIKKRGNSCVFFHFKYPTHLQDGLLAAKAGARIVAHKAIGAHGQLVLYVEGGLGNRTIAVLAGKMLRMPGLAQGRDNPLLDDLIAFVTNRWRLRLYLKNKRKRDANKIINMYITWERRSNIS